MTIAAANPDRSKRKQRPSLLALGRRLAAWGIIPFAVTACASDPIDRGLSFWQRGDCVGALNRWLPEAKEGNPVAQNNMALIWERGCSPAQIPQSYAEAYNWLLLSAQSGFWLSLRNLGTYEERGLGRPVDLKKAAALYTLAARKGDEPSRLALVRLGQPVPPADLVAVSTPAPEQPPAPVQEQGSWAQAIATALLMKSAEDRASSQKMTCTSEVINKKAITRCR
jgi:TPR repeat protein